MYPGVASSCLVFARLCHTALPFPVKAKLVFYLDSDYSEMIDLEVPHSMC